jgi:dTDP-4-amino-4,6-dideoxygalactose transaminase
MAAISALARQYDISIIEDASHALGARYHDSVTGDCRFSDITVFSFHPVKIITTGEGGVATTNSSKLARKMQLLRSHGITREITELFYEQDGPWYYEQQCLGYNYRITDMQAALGTSQMRSLGQRIERRHYLANRYDAALADLPLTLPVWLSNMRSALHLYVIQIDTDRTNVTRRVLFDYLRQARIGVNVHYIPVHTQPDFQRLGFSKGQFPASEAYYSRCISLPMYSSLDESHQDYVIANVRAVFA